MSSSLFSVLAQSNSGSDWNWLLIFIIFVVVLAVAMILQTRFSSQEAEELAHEIHHDEEIHDETPETELIPTAESEPEMIPEPKTMAAPDSEVVPPAPDDLKMIEGIGPKVASLLNENGIVTFAQLAEMHVDTLTDILEASKLQMLNPTSWPQQARLAADGDWEALEKLQDDLKGGR